MMNRWKWTGLAAGLLMAAMTVLPMGKVMTGSNPGTGDDSVRIGWLVAAGVDALFAAAVLIGQRKKA